MTELESLLRRYAQGDITQEELQRLDTLSHRDEVLAGAAVRARTLRRQRAARMTVAASVAVVVALVAVIALRVGNPAGVADNVLEASMTTPPAVTTTLETMAVPAEVQAPARQTARPAAAREVAQAVPPAERNVPQPAAEALQEPPVPVQVREEVPVTVHGAEGYPVVACNSECSPDSVINDIWRFLRV
jgi:hypothetical protein